MRMIKLTDGLRRCSVTGERYFTSHRLTRTSFRNALLAYRWLISPHCSGDVRVAVIFMPHEEGTLLRSCRNMQPYRGSRSAPDNGSVGANTLGVLDVGEILLLEVCDDDLHDGIQHHTSSRPGERKRGERFLMSRDMIMSSADTLADCAYGPRRDRRLPACDWAARDIQTEEPSSAPSEEIASASCPFACIFPLLLHTTCCFPPSDPT